ncbi:MAG: toll/interleukin-1 receptor domain-containing protein [Anaerolineae bacterium]|nr:toll/interleukin-1 receptor domain-containing protein [Anaerolineae bacterium]
MFNKALAELDVTSKSLVSDLWQRQNAEDLIFKSSTANEEASPASLRAAAAYVEALLAYGLPPQNPELWKIAERCDQPVLDKSQMRFDAVEMYRLEILLQLRPTSKTTADLLLALARLYMEHKDDLSQSDPYNTVWTIKILAFARQKRVLGELVKDEVILKSINDLLPKTHRPADIALLLYLQHKLKGSTTSTLERYIKKLVDIAEEGDGFWGASPENKPMLAALKAHHFKAVDLINQRERLRDIIFNTCTVIENLSPLVGDYPVLEKPVQRAMTQWWNVFKGADALSTLQILFPSSYDYLLVTSRTLGAANAFVGHAIASLNERPLAYNQPDLLLESPPILEPQGEPEEVAFTHFYPSTLEIGTYSPLHVYIHLLSLWEKVQADFEARDNMDVKPMSLTEPSSAPFARGTTFTIIPQIFGVKVKPERMDVTWEDDIEHVQFEVKPKPDAKIELGLKGSVRIYVGSLVAAELPIVCSSGKFLITETRKYATETRPRYKKIFVSYSRKDSAVVKAIVRLYSKYPDIKTFIDYDFLQAADYWWPTIQQKIEESDVLQLFWSVNSAESPNVDDEWRYAMKLSRPIVPVILEPKPPIPPELQHIHFEEFDRFIERL